MDDFANPQVQIGMEMRALMNSISELTRLAVEHKDLMRPDLFDLRISHSRLALLISAVDAKPHLQAAE
jgi:hypothetical protein